MFFNFLILRANRDAIESLDYDGLVVDLGCGTASYAEFIESKGATYIGVDWSKSFHTSNRPIVEADLTTRVPLEDCCADIVTSFQVLEHIPNPEHFLSECLRLLKPGGRLYLMTPFMWHIHEEPYDYYRYTRFGLEHLIDEAGLRVEVLQETLGFWCTWVLKFNYHVNRKARRPVRYLMAPGILVGQVVARVLDRFDPDVAEAAGYLVVAIKPGVESGGGPNGIEDEPTDLCSDDIGSAST